MKCFQYGVRRVITCGTEKDKACTAAWWGDF